MLEWIGSKMNERILKLALDAGLLNYVDNETPRHYFVHGHADLEEVEKFAELIVRECVSIGDNYQDILGDDPECFNCRKVAYGIVDKIKQHFGVEE